MIPVYFDVPLHGHHRYAELVVGDGAAIVLSTLPGINAGPPSRFAHSAAASLIWVWIVGAKGNS